MTNPSIARSKQTRNFKKLEEEQKPAAIPPLLRLYQDEIDALTKRSKYAENAFLSIYKSGLSRMSPFPHAHTLAKAPGYDPGPGALPSECCAGHGGSLPGRAARGGERPPAAGDPGGPAEGQRPGQEEDPRGGPGPSPGGDRATGPHSILRPR
ncbi:CCAAT-displacement protein alternatively spliced product [Paratrimastix pyriformis]|uniref:CCAAT-displacement protein alternatively spliced product n=1 Tax=Paratrimastix pyriformis TaxID=342808 RepID=A0ABQ9YMU6_9EUKA|nr:CCAAT-displacement protein alternatively spliced product [Paratrimastix pyriformis]